MPQDHLSVHPPFQSAAPLGLMHKHNNFTKSVVLLVGYGQRFSDVWPKMYDGRWRSGSEIKSLRNQMRQLRAICTRLYAGRPVTAMRVVYAWHKTTCIREFRTRIKVQFGMRRL